MSRTDGVLEAIDGALEDWSVSDDAMRWVPPDDRDARPGSIRTLPAWYQPNVPWTDVGYLDALPRVAKVTVVIEMSNGKTETITMPSIRDMTMKVEREDPHINVYTGRFGLVESCIRDVTFKMHDVGEFTIQEDQP